MTALAPAGPPAGGVVRLLNTADGRVLCLAGNVDDEAVAAFRRRYGPEPVRVDGIDVRSVTSLSPPARDLLRDHLDAADRAGRSVTVRPSSPCRPTPPPAPSGADARP